MKKICINCGKSISNRSVYCSNICQQKYQTKQKWKDFIDNPNNYQRANYSPSKWIKPFILEEQDNKCNICHCLPFHNNKNLVFILDHIDGNASNNLRENLRLICPNCDSQLDTYKSKNKNSAREYRYKK